MVRWALVRGPRYKLWKNVGCISWGFFFLSWAPGSDSSDSFLFLSRELCSVHIRLLSRLVINSSNLRANHFSFVYSPFWKKYIKGDVPWRRRIRMGKQEIVYTSLKDLDIGWCGKSWLGKGAPKLGDSWNKSSGEIVSSWSWTASHWEFVVARVGQLWANAETAACQMRLR